MRFRALSRAKQATLVVALVGALAGGAGIALATSGPPAPTIASSPANPTAATSARFAFSDSQAGVSFSCSLDGAAFAACTSPKVYTGLAAGAHTFAVRAQSTSGTSASASYGWTIDLSPPVVGIAFPANGGSYNAARWGAGCPGGAGVCGTAGDPSGVSSVAVSIRQGAGNWWGGTSFNRTSEFFITATGTTSWSYPLALPRPDGSYTVHVRATDSLGNTTPASSYAMAALTIDTQPTPAPTITQKPASLSGPAASFSFTDPEAGVTFLCKLDAGSFSACQSPISYSQLADGSHTFSVEASDAAGNVSGPVSWTWTVDGPPPAPAITQQPSNPTSSYTVTFAFTDAEAGNTFECRLDAGTWTACASPTSYSALGAGQHNFSVRAADPAGNRSPETGYAFVVTVGSGQPVTISGNAPSLLYPGAAAVPIAVHLTNPNSVAIYITSLSVTLSSTGLPPGCNGTWFHLVPSNISTTNTVQIPANGSVTLPRLGASAPSIQLLDSGTVQDACKAAHLTLSYTGTARSS